MIAAVRGEVIAKTLSSVVVDVRGLGLEVHVTPRTLGELHGGQEALLRTALVARKDDAPLLFGFGTEQDREVFETLRSVSGIGPRTALAILGEMDADGVAAAIAAGDPKPFTRVSGIGPKGAKRIVLELAGKLVPADQPQAPAAGPQKAPEQPAWRLQVTQALTGLGWQEKDASAAIDDALSGREELAQTGDVPVILRTVLAYLGQRASTGHGTSAGGAR